MDKAAIRTVRPREIRGGTAVELKNPLQPSGRITDPHPMEIDLNEKARLIAAGLELREEGRTLRAALRAYFDVFDSDEATIPVREECVRLASQSLLTALHAGSGGRPKAMA